MELCSSMLPGLKYTKFFVFVFVGRDIPESAGWNGPASRAYHDFGALQRPADRGRRIVSPELTQLETHPLASTDSRRDMSATEAPPCATSS